MKSKITLLALFCVLAGHAQAPTGYYSSATGSGYSLKTQLYNIIKGHTDNGYSGLWTTYQTSDRDKEYENDNSIIDVYSENPLGVDPYVYQYGTNQCGTYSTEGGCYNREHMIPQSVFNSVAPMVSDAHFIPPTDGKVNGMRSNYPHGMVAVASWTSKNGGKLGSSAVSGYTGTVFEPINEFKGDIARMYFYFATRYENTVAGYTTYEMFNGTSNQVFTKPFLDMLLQWHAQDPVSSREIARNNAIYARQGNRNPFIDNPNYVNIIWGGSVADTTAPTLPSNLISTGITSTGFTLSWTASTDNVGVTSYNVYQDGVLKISVTGTTATITGLIASTTYSFTVKAKDAAGNLSATSSALSITTATVTDTTAPSAPNTLSASNITTTGCTLSWAVSTDNVGVTAYDVYQGSTLKTSVTGTSVTITGLSASSTYSFAVKARDAVGNSSSSSPIVNVTTPAPSGTIYCVSTSNNTTDEKIGNVTLANLNNNSIGTNGYEDFSTLTALVSKNSTYTLSVKPIWSSTVYAEGYAAWIDYNKNGVFTDPGEQVANISPSSATTVTATFVVPATATLGTTKMRVSMRYNAVPTSCETLDYGQVEDYTVSITDPIVDTAAPTAPTSLTSSNLTSTSCSLSWIGSTDNLGVVGYDVYQGSILKTSVVGTTVSITGLTASTTYSFTVKAKDASGNISDSSNVLTITTAGSTSAVTDLYFSEYLEGSSNNKALEITNRTGTSVNLSAYVIKKQTNGAGSWSTGLTLSGILVSNGKYVIVNSSIASSCYSTATANVATAAGEMAYNGNDAIGLFKNGILVDIIGTFNGGTADFSVDETIRRKSTAVVPSVTFNKLNDWDLYSLDTCSGLGNRVVKSSHDKKIINLFPNPTKGNFEITFEDLSQKYTIEIYTTLGQKVREINEITSGIVSVNDLSKGIYLVKINQNEDSIVKQIVVE
ncbi:endonuclease [Flavobacterium oreochromis]|uniref:Endonuclease I n=1 Tax=Flavobacterium columnare TaxID=996 RepID=A0A246G8Y2_9FLAO|nr:endonuclease [Flavobacterium oreochromis]OWP75736.1 hypothetical protein BWK62_11260 [Flavobacterium oreochromis]